MKKDRKMFGKRWQEVILLPSFICDLKFNCLWRRKNIEIISIFFIVKKLAIIYNIIDKK